MGALEILFIIIIILLLYEEVVAAAASSQYFQKPNTCLSDDNPIYNGEAIL